MTSSPDRPPSKARVSVNEAPVKTDQDASLAAVPSALALIDLWLNWPYACLAIQRECQDAWLAHWGGGVPLDG